MVKGSARFEGKKKTDAAMRAKQVKTRPKCSGPPFLGATTPSPRDETSLRQITKQSRHAGAVRAAGSKELQRKLAEHVTGAELLRHGTRLHRSRDR